MNLKKLLSVATLFVAGALGFNANAQYTVNDLTSSGWTKVESITDVNNHFYVLVDAGSSNYAVSFVNDHDRPIYQTLADPLENPAQMWILESNGENYALKNMQAPSYFNSGNAGWNDYMDVKNNDANYSFELADGKYSIKSTQVNQLVGPWNDDGAVKGNGEEVAANKASEDAPGFYIYSISRTDYIAKRQSLLTEATKANPIEVTSYIFNSNFSGNRDEGWTRTGSWGNQQWGNGSMESWNNNNVTIQNSLCGLPDGTYKVSVDIISGPGTPLNAYLFANGGLGELKSANVSAVASAGNYGTMGAEVAGNTVTIENIVVSGGTLTIGVKDPSSGNGWIVLDNFKLWYYGNQIDLSIFIDAYNTALNAANEYRTAEMSDFALSALNTAITNNTIADPENSTQEALEAATTNLNIAVESAKVAVSSWTFVKNGVIPTDNAAGWAISTKNGELACNTWSTEGNSDGSGMTTPFVQNWVASGTPLAGGEAGGKLYYTLEGLVPGTKYSVSALVRAFNESATGVEGASFFVGSDKKSIDEYGSSCIGDFTAKGKFGNFTCTGEVDSEGKLVFGIELESTSAINWVAIKNVTIEESSGIVPTSIALDNTNISLITGNTATITATITPDDAEDKTIVWSSSDPTIATVSGGVVTGLKPGNVTITAAALAGNNVTATATITVANAAAPAYYSEIADGGDFYIVNAATGMYLGGGNAYGTQISLIPHGIPFTVGNAGEGVYTLDTHTFNGSAKHYIDGGYVDGNPTNLYIKPVGEGKYTISTADGSAYFTASAGTTVVANTGTDATNSLAQWYFVSKKDRDKTLASATTANPVDATYYIPNASFSRGMNTANNANKWSVEASNNNLDSQSNCAESYHSTFDVRQTITVPNGKYRFRAQGFYRQDGTDNDNLPYFFIEDQKITFPVRTGSEGSMDAAGTSFRSGLYYTDYVEVVVEDREITLGCKLETNTALWCIWDNFELEMINIPQSTVTKNISANKYSTFIAPFDVTIPEGVTASKVTGTEGEILVFEGLEETIPANTPVVLYSENGCEETFIGTDLSTDVTYTVGLLTGTYEESTTVPAGSYVLQTQDNGQKFYLVGANTTFNMPNRAYLTVPAESAGVKAFSFGGETTGINGVETLTDGAVESIYTINGTRVNSLQKGLNIVKMSNGKTQKVLVK